MLRFHIALENSLEYLYVKHLTYCNIVEHSIRTWTYWEGEIETCCTSYYQLLKDCYFIALHLIAQILKFSYYISFCKLKFCLLVTPCSIQTGVLVRGSLLPHPSFPTELQYEHLIHLIRVTNYVFLLYNMWGYPSSSYGIKTTRNMI